jgi:AcrR family transcriptional regulator
MRRFVEDQMDVRRKDAVLTREKLLASASEVFADKGYRDATIAEICEQARANIASVNYHFGTKEKLYVEAWRHAFIESIKAHPPDGGVSVDAPPEDRLRGQIKALLQRIADRGNREFQIMQKEFSDPTDILKDVTRELIESLHTKMKMLVSELLGPCVSDQQVEFCVISIVNQCVSPIVARRSGKRKGNSRGAFKKKCDIDAYAEHVANFSLAGIRAIRGDAEKE